MKRTTEMRDPSSVGIDARPVEEILKVINAEDATIAGVIRGQIPKIAEAAEAVAEVVSGGGRVFFVGAGTSGRLGIIEAAEMPPTFGLPCEVFQGIIAGGPEAMFRSAEAAEDDEASGVAALDERGFDPNDLLVALSASGGTPFVQGALKRARGLGARTVSVTCNSGAAVSGLAEVPIVVEVGPEVVAGSTRMKAGTAQKLVLNMVTVAAMARLGRVYDGYMVGVQATSAKLRERGEFIVMEIVGVEREEAAGVLEEAGGDVRVAVIMAARSASPEGARRALKEAGGSLRRALEGLGAEDS
jgi:N-acetylmuramic acid 6-phosphate etherase